MPSTFTISASRAPARTISPNGVFFDEEPKSDQHHGGKAHDEKPVPRKREVPEKHAPLQGGGRAEGNAVSSEQYPDQLYHDVAKAKSEQQRVAHIPAVERPEQISLREHAEHRHNDRNDDKRDPEVSGVAECEYADIRACRVEGAVGKVHDVEHPEDQGEGR